MQPAPASVTTAIRHVSPSAFAEAGSTITSFGPYTGSITVLRGQPSLALDGKPLIAYVGSNWCPYCAAARWPLAIALSRFGSFQRLQITASGEIDPGIATLSFYGSTYTSPFIAFLPTEQCTDIQSSSASPAVEDCNGYEPLQPLSPTARKIFLKYDFPPYVSSTYESGIPFIDFANELIENGAFMDPSILAGFTHVQIA
jgi:thiol-disulfide isomerase/thioredoxin